MNSHKEVQLVINAIFWGHGLILQIGDGLFAKTTDHPLEAPKNSVGSRSWLVLVVQAHTGGRGGPLSNQYDPFRRDHSYTGVRKLWRPGTCHSKGNQHHKIPIVLPLTKE